MRSFHVDTLSCRHTAEAVGAGSEIFVPILRSAPRAVKERTCLPCFLGEVISQATSAGVIIAISAERSTRQSAVKSCRGHAGDKESLSARTCRYRIADESAKFFYEQY